jgi:RNA polymerase sigma-70 factor, ECF subfamily
LAFRREDGESCHFIPGFIFESYTTVTDDAGISYDGRPSYSSCAQRETAVSDDQWLKSVAGGDSRALEKLYLSYYRRLTKFLSRLAPRSESIEEILNDTFMVVWLHAGEFRHASRVSTWIFGIAYRIALKSLRQHKRWHAASADGQPERVTDPTQATEDHDWMAQGLGRLSQEQRLGLMLTYHWGHSVREVAAMTDCPVGTVKARLFHARVKLRVHLTELRGAM